MRSGRRHTPRIALATIVALAALAGACSSSAKNPSGSPTTSVQPGPVVAIDAATAYEAAGPNPVGVTTRTLPTGNKVEIWYPAVKGTTGTVTYDVRDFLAPAIKALIKGNLNATFSIAAGRDAPVAAGRFPIVLFSHGFSGMRLQSSYLTSHLASWGMVVAAPDHPSRDLFHALQGQFGTAASAVADLSATLQLVEHDAQLEGHVDPARVAAVGHSAGGATVAAAAAQIAGIDGYVSLASGTFANRTSSSSSTAATTSTTTAPIAPVPSLFVAGADDQVAPPATVTRPAFAAAHTPTELWIIDKSGHNVFDDFCTLGGGKGIIGLAEASGLGGFLDAQPQFRKLGQDGCFPPDAPVRTAWPIIRHVVTAWLRHLFGVDRVPVGLSAGVATRYPLKVTIEVRPG